MSGAMVVLAVVVLGVAAAGALRKDRFRRGMKRYRLVRIADLVDDEPARITGVVKALGAPIEAGLTGRPCFVSSFQLTERRGYVDEEVHAEVAATPFIVEDDSGSAIVDPQHARVEVIFDVYADRASLTGHTPRLDAAFKRARLRPEVMKQREIGCSEGVIQVGDTVEIAGTGRHEPDEHGTGGEFRTPTTRVRLIASDKEPLWIAKTRVTRAERPTSS